MFWHFLLYANRYLLLTQFRLSLYNCSNCCLEIRIFFTKDNFGRKCYCKTNKKSYSPCLSVTMDGICSSFPSLVKKNCSKKRKKKITFFPKEMECSRVSDLAFFDLNKIRRYHKRCRSEADIKSKDPKLTSFDQF